MAAAKRSHPYLPLFTFTSKALISRFAPSGVSSNRETLSSEFRAKKKTSTQRRVRGTGRTLTHSGHFLFSFLCALWWWRARGGAARAVGGGALARRRAAENSVHRGTCGFVTFNSCLPRRWRGIVLARTCYMPGTPTLQDHRAETCTASTPKPPLRSARPGRHCHR